MIYNDDKFLRILIIIQPQCTNSIYALLVNKKVIDDWQLAKATLDEILQLFCLRNVIMFINS